MKDNLEMPINEPYILTKNRLIVSLRLMRPWQWTKNAFVFVGILFSKGWNDPLLIMQAMVLFVSFCLLSSSVYILNDIIDREKDKVHPTKRYRPLPLGLLSISSAVVLFIVTIFAALLLGTYISKMAVFLLLLYFGQNLAYSLYLKQVVILDVFIIAAGFMIRILVGTLGIGIAPSDWLLLCGFMLTLFLGFSKRWSEINEMTSNTAVFYRSVLRNYDAQLLDQMMMITATATIITYSLYTVDPVTIALHATRNLVYTVPLVAYGIFRYLYLMRVHKSGEPSTLILKDIHLLFVVMAWIISVILLLS